MHLLFIIKYLRLQVQQKNGKKEKIVWKRNIAEFAFIYPFILQEVKKKVKLKSYSFENINFISFHFVFKLRKLYGESF